MFLGSYKYSIDSKGRISIPAKMRKSLKPEANETFIMTIGTEKCIVVYPLDEWKKLNEKILEKTEEFITLDDRARREMFSNATDDKFDTQARLLLPKHLIAHAELEKEALIIGVMNKIEIWDPKNYDTYRNGGEQTYSEMMENVMSKKEKVKGE
ncbi:MAG: division/cell wall cluster transcriptional repressor MraZ [Melioribacteraceae bacterium]